MTRPLKSTTLRQEAQLVITIKLLHSALVHALHADAPGTVKAIGRALKSAMRAQRRMGRRRRTEKDTP